MPAPAASAGAPLAAPPRSPAKIVWGRLVSNPITVGAMIVIALLILASLLGPLFTGYGYDEVDESAGRYESPSAAHWLGTDGLARDNLTRLLTGGRISLAVGFFASLISVTIGVIYGAVSGYAGGWVDRLMMRFVDTLNAIPLMLFVIVLMILFEPGLRNIFIALGLFYWLNMARIVRGQVLSLKSSEYVLAARALGASRRRIILRHLIPNTLGPIIVTLTLNIPSAIFTEAYLSYLGLGVSAPMASWGYLADEGVKVMGRNATLLIASASAISLTMLAFNYLGDALRDAFDPRIHRD